MKSDDMKQCERCGKELDDFEEYQNTYGETLCFNCFEEETFLEQEEEEGF